MTEEHAYQIRERMQAEHPRWLLTYVERYDDTPGVALVEYLATDGLLAGQKVAIRQVEDYERLATGQEVQA